MRVPNNNPQKGPKVILAALLCSQAAEEEERNAYTYSDRL